MTRTIDAHSGTPDKAVFLHALKPENGFGNGNIVILGVAGLAVVVVLEDSALLTLFVSELF